MDEMRHHEALVKYACEFGSTCDSRFEDQCNRNDCCMIGVEAAHLVMGGLDRGGPLSDAAHQRIMERNPAQPDKRYERIVERINNLGGRLHTVRIGNNVYKGLWVDRDNVLSILREEFGIDDH